MCDASFQWNTWEYAAALPRQRLRLYAERRKAPRPPAWLNKWQLLHISRRSGRLPLGIPFWNTFIKTLWPCTCWILKRKRVRGREKKKRKIWVAAKRKLIKCDMTVLCHRHRTHNHSRAQCGCTNRETLKQTVIVSFLLTLSTRS